jgi:hypothetical protein
MSIAVRLAEIRRRIDAAARSAGRDPSAVRLVAISKTFPVAVIREASLAGQRDFGENRVQEALEKIHATNDLDVSWHLVGHLQTNKARKAATAFSTIQSIDSVELLEKVDTAAAEADSSPAVLIQLDLAGEATKFGVPPGEAPRLFEAAVRCRAARLKGLMIIPPVAAGPEQARPWFRQLRELRDRWVASGVPAPMLNELSMGMSADYEVAIQEGATMVRIGTAIFGSRTPAE